MYSKVSIRQEDFYWKKQIERHHMGKRVRGLLKKEIHSLDKYDKEKPYRSLAGKLNVNRRTVWALANGLTIASQKLIEKIERLENEIL